MTTEEDVSQKIRALNDKFRQRIPNVTDIQGVFILTRGVRDLTDTDREPAKYFGELMRVIREYDDFTEGNDPYGEHDFGVFTFQGVKCFWKIDYYADDAMLYGSASPEDVNSTYRALTVMLADEY